MKFYWRLQLLEGKRAFRKLPQILLGAVVLIGIVGTIAFCGQKLLYQDEASGRIRIAVVTDGESETVDLVLSFLEHMETVASLCSFTRTDQAQGMAMLKDGRAAALMEVPGSLVEDIISGPRDLSEGLRGCRFLAGGGDVSRSRHPCLRSVWDLRGLRPLLELWAGV